MFIDIYSMNYLIISTQVKKNGILMSEVQQVSSRAEVGEVARLTYWLQDYAEIFSSPEYR